jgi:hypothetical protein
VPFYALAPLQRQGEFLLVVFGGLLIAAAGVRNLKFSFDSGHLPLNAVSTLTL